MSARILIIEDNPANMELMSYLLRAYGHLPVAAMNGREGIRLARAETFDLRICDVHLPDILLTATGMMSGLVLARQECPDLVLSDLGMSDGSGFDFIKMVKADENLATIPFIFITSTYCDESYRQRGLALGAVRVLFRPIDPQIILTEIQTCFGERKGS